MKLRLDNLQSLPHSTPPIDPPTPGTTAAPSGHGSPAAPATGADVVLGDRLAEVLAGLLEVEQVPVDADFFQD